MRTLKELNQWYFANDKQLTLALEKANIGSWWKLSHADKNQIWEFLNKKGEYQIESQEVGNA